MELNFRDFVLGKLPSDKETAYQLQDARAQTAATGAGPSGSNESGSQSVNIPAVKTEPLETSPRPLTKFEQYSRNKLLCFCDMVLKYEGVWTHEDWQKKRVLEAERDRLLAQLPEWQREQIKKVDEQHEKERVAKLMKEFHAEGKQLDSEFRTGVVQEPNVNVVKVEKKPIIPKTERNASSPLNSVGESAHGSVQSGSSVDESEVAEEEEEYDEEAYESVSCWCGQPWHGRPMIECGKCTVWYHMICEDIEENNVPVEFICKTCKSKKRRKRSSTSSRKGGKKKRTSGTPSKSKPEPAPPRLEAHYSSLPSPLRQDPVIGMTPPSESGSTETDKGYDSLPNDSESSSSRSLIKSERNVENAHVHMFSSPSTNSSSTVTFDSYDKRVASPPFLFQPDMHQNVPSATEFFPPPILPCYAEAGLSSQGLYYQSEISNLTPPYAYDGGCPTLFNRGDKTPPYVQPPPDDLGATESPPLKAVTLYELLHGKVKEEPSSPSSSSP